MSHRSRSRNHRSNKSFRNHYAGHKKTELCRDHIAGTCERGPECSFAHGVDELKPRVLEVGNYKTEKCEMWENQPNKPTDKRCQYGTRCHFSHDEVIVYKHEDLKVLFSEAEQMYRIIRKVNNSGRSRRHRHHRGPCDEVRSCSSALMPQSWLSQYQIKVVQDDEKSFKSEHSDYYMDEDTRSPISTFSTASDVDSVVSSHVSSHVSSQASSRQLDMSTFNSIATVSCRLPSTVSTVTQDPSVHDEAGSLLRMTSVSQQSQRKAELTVEIPSLVTSIRGDPDPISPQVVSMGFSSPPSPQLQTTIIHPPQPQMTQPQTQTIQPQIPQIPQAPQPQQAQQAQQIVFQHSAQPIPVQQFSHQSPMGTAYVSTYVTVMMQDGTTQLIPVLSPVGQAHAMPTMPTMPTMTTSSSAPNPQTSSQPPSPQQMSVQYVQPLPQQQISVVQAPLNISPGNSPTSQLIFSSPPTQAVNPLPMMA